MNAQFEELLKKADEAGTKAAAKIKLKDVVDGNGYVCVKLTVSGKMPRREWSAFALWYAGRPGYPVQNIGCDGVRHDIPRLTGNIYNGVSKKEAYAEAFCTVVREAGFYASSWTRLD